MQYRGRLNVSSDRGEGIPVILTIDDVFLNLMSGDEDLGTWRLDAVAVDREAGERFALVLAGEQMVFSAEDPLGFAYSGVTTIEDVGQRLGKRRFGRLRSRRSRGGVLGTEAPESTGPIRLPRSPLDLPSTEFHPIDDDRQPARSETSPERPAAAAAEPQPMPAAAASHQEHEFRTATDEADAGVFVTDASADASAIDWVPGDEEVRQPASLVREEVTEGKGDDDDLAAAASTEGLLGPVISDDAGSDGVDEDGALVVEGDDQSVVAGPGDDADDPATARSDTSSTDVSGPEDDATLIDASDEEPTGLETTDIEAPDGEVPDGELPDGEVPDGEVPDGEVPDGEVPDGEAPDGEGTDDGPFEGDDLGGRNTEAEALQDVAPEDQSLEDPAPGIVDDVTHEAASGDIVDDDELQHDAPEEESTLRAEEVEGVDPAAESPGVVADGDLADEVEDLPDDETGEASVTGDASGHDRGGFEDVLDDWDVDDEAPEAAVADVEVPDADVSDVEAPEAAVADVEVPDVGVSDVDVSEVDVSDDEVSEVEVSDVGVPEVDVSDVGAPEPAVSDDEVSEVEVSDVELSDVGVADVDVSDDASDAVVSDADVDVVDVPDVDVPDVEVEGDEVEEVEEVEVEEVEVEEVEVEEAEVEEVDVPDDGETDDGGEGDVSHEVDDFESGRPEPSVLRSAVNSAAKVAEEASTSSESTGGERAGGIPRESQQQAILPERRRRRSIFGRRSQSHEHDYQETKTVGGITRRVCADCGHVSFEGTDVYDGWT